MDAQSLLAEAMGAFGSDVGYAVRIAESARELPESVMRLSPEELVAMRAAGCEPPPLLPSPPPPPPPPRPTGDQRPLSAAERRKRRNEQVRSRRRRRREWEKSLPPEVQEQLAAERRDAWRRQYARRRSQSEQSTPRNRIVAEEPLRFGPPPEARGPSSRAVHE